MLGLSHAAFTTLHVIISLIGIAAGLAVVAAMIADRYEARTTAIFLGTTVATSVTGFMFEFNGVTPGHVFGTLSLVALGLALHALYIRELAGKSRLVYVVGAVFALYLNAFVAVVQAFQKIGFLQPLAPTQSEPPFQIAQLVLLVAFVGAGYLATKRFRHSV